jgi:hypothetical protein
VGRRCFNCFPAAIYAIVFDVNRAVFSPDMEEAFLPKNLKIRTKTRVKSTISAKTKLSMRLSPKTRLTPRPKKARRVKQARRNPVMAQVKALVMVPVRVTGHRP